MSIVSEIGSGRGIIRPVSLRAVAVEVDAPALAVGDRASNDRSCCQAAQHRRTVSVVATVIAAIPAIVAVAAFMSPTAAMMAKVGMAILDRLDTRSNLSACESAIGGAAEADWIATRGAAPNNAAASRLLNSRID